MPTQKNFCILQVVKQFVETYIILQHVFENLNGLTGRGSTIH